MKEGLDESHGCRGGEIKSKCGDIKSECGDIESERGDIESERGDVKSEHGDIESAHRDIKSKCGDIESEHGDIESKHREDKQSCEVTSTDLMRDNFDETSDFLESEHNMTLVRKGCRSHSTWAKAGSRRGSEGG